MNTNMIKGGACMHAGAGPLRLLRLYRGSDIDSPERTGNPMILHAPPGPYYSPSRAAAPTIPSNYVELSIPKMKCSDTPHYIGQPPNWPLLGRQNSVSLLTEQPYQFYGCREQRPPPLPNPLPFKIVSEILYREGVFTSSPYILKG